ncbi:thymidine kinase [Granulicoccus phenolivorans]|uniref:thymidine kinase n=1 Tax=Granulicoccus phenolivorans TaxID=266854 RepID=UPI001FDEC9E9
MDCGKSTLALQMDYTQTLGGRAGLRFTRQDRSGKAKITSRLGLAEEAIEVDTDFDFWKHLVHALTSGGRVDYLICDEAQFYTAAQVDQLARIVDELEIDVFAYGILSDFRSELFPGSKRLVELCDRLETLQVQPLCWCGSRGTHNARLVDGKMVTEGEQIAVGDTRPEPESEYAGTLLAGTLLGAEAEPSGQVTYEVLCRRHHRRRVTKAIAQANLSPDPLPFGGTIKPKHQRP